MPERVVQTQRHDPGQGCPLGVADQHLPLPGNRIVHIDIGRGDVEIAHHQHLG